MGCTSLTDPGRIGTTAPILSMVRRQGHKMKRKYGLLFSLVLLSMVPITAYAQLWTGIIDPSRAVDWSKPGMPGGIPNRTTICATLTAGASAATINSAIAACPSGQVVFLSAGTYNLSAGLVMKSNVTLRGAGADQTFLVFTGATSCGQSADVCFMGEDVYYGSTWVAPGGTQAADWTGGYSAGTTQITLTNVGSKGLSVGQYIYLDQVNSSADNGNFFVCDNTTTPCSLEGVAPGRPVSGSAVARNEIQIVKITAISGSTYTITPGLYAQNWATSFSPGAWWPSVQFQNAGIENLSMDHTNSTDTIGMMFFNAFNCWVKGVRSISPNRNHVWFFQAAHNQVQDNYFFGTKNSATSSYGVESFISSDNLVVNNIFQQVTAPIEMGPSQGSVFAYNFSINDTYTVAAWLIQGVSMGHDAGVMYNLFEGNNGSGYWGDLVHGTSGLNTVFRNRAVGWESGKTGDTVSVQLYSYKRYENIIGNVLGQFGYHTTYQTSKGVNASAAIYDLGAGNTNGSVTVPSDSLVATTLMRWGNYDVVNAAVRFVNSEVPSGISPYANPVPASSALPPSFYLNAKPSWWPSAKAWPPIGPDVTGGNLPNLGGFAYTIPAQDCFANVMAGPADGTGSVLAFNPNNCYTTQSGPAPPTNLTVIVK